jgi:hypothetical protein
MIEFVEETRNLLSQHPSWVTDQIIKGITMRRQAKTMEEEAKAIKEQANGLLSMAMTIAKAKKIGSTGGNVALKKGSRSTLNQTKLKEILVLKGVNPKVVVEAVEEATSTTEYESVDFREAKEKVG